MPATATDTPGQIMKRRRKERGLSQDELAEGAKLSQGYISQIERGERRLTLNVARRADTAMSLNRELEALVDDAPTVIHIGGTTDHNTDAYLQLAAAA